MSTANPDTELPSSSDLFERLEKAATGFAVNSETAKLLREAAEHIGLVNEESATTRRRHEYAKSWYAVRNERLKDLGKEHGLWSEIAAIMANGTMPGETPTYAQQLNKAKHRAERAEKAASEAQALVRRLRTCLELFAHQEPHYVLALRCTTADVLAETPAMSLRQENADAWDLAALWVDEVAQDQPELGEALAPIARRLKGRAGCLLSDRHRQNALTASE